MTGHAEALELAQRLKQADASTAPDCRRALLLYWYGSGASHLRAEEDLLLSAWERHGGTDHPLNAAIRAEHARLAEQVAAVAEDPRPGADELRSIGTALAGHVHRHERELARAVARSLAPEERIQLEKELARFEGAVAGA
jgi:hypothetical protein